MVVPSGTHTVDKILGPLDAFVLLTILVYILSHLGRITYNPSNRREHSLLFPAFLRQWGLAMSAPIKVFVVKTGVHPNTLSFLGFVFMLLSGVCFGFGLVGLGAWAIVFGGLMDVFDGMIAREQGYSSKRGAFIDSTLDRYGEGMMFLGLAALFLKNTSYINTFIAAAAMLGSLLVSYTKARGEALGVTCSTGILQRPERLLILALGAGIDPILYWFGVQEIWGTVVAIWVVALFSHVTVLQRIYAISSKLKTQDNG